MHLSRKVPAGRTWRAFVSFALVIMFLGLQCVNLLPLPAAQASPADEQTTTANDLAVGAGSTKIIDVSNSSVLNIRGNLKNAGTIYVVSTNPDVATATITARNIFNRTGALLSTVLPDAGLAGFANAINNLSLSLVALNNIVNNGAITSANNLTLAAGGSITNVPGGTGAPAPVMQAVNTVNILANAIVNQGTIASMLSNVNLANHELYSSVLSQLPGLQMAQTLAQFIGINNTLGTIRAANGNINIGSDALLSKSVLALLGGTFAANEINFNGGCGAVEATLGNALGTVNVSAGVAHLGVLSGTLNLGNLTLTGDPTFFNDLGDININGNITAGEDLAILAAGNVTSTSGTIITARDGNQQGRNIYIVAGAQLQRVGNPQPTPISTITPTSTGILPGQSVRVNGGNLIGGSISLNDMTLDTSSTTGNLNGGTVNLIAYGGPSAGGIENVKVVTSGSGTGANGEVNVIAGGNLNTINPMLPTNTAINKVGVNATGGLNTKVLARINITAAQPALGTVTFTNTGKALGKFAPGTPTNGNINLNTEIKTEGGDITVRTAGNIVTSALVSSSGINAGRNAGAIVFDADGTITVGADILANGTNGAAGAAGLAPAAAGAGGDGGNAGAISLIGDGGIAVNANISANAGSGGAGGLGGNGPASRVGGAGGLGGDGGMDGSITLVTKDTAITQAGASTISANGGTGGAGGKGGDGGDGTGNSNGGNAGFGGIAGTASTGGMITFKSGAGTQTLSGTINANGGDGGNGGAGGVGGDSINGTAGDGGFSGISKDGGTGGSIGFSTSSGNITTNVISANGGIGGNSGVGGDGGLGGKIGGDGGRVGGSGGGGSGGMIGYESMTGTVQLNGAISLFGGAAGNQTNKGGEGGSGINMGGAGGSVNDAGAGGDGGRFSILTGGGVTVAQTIDAYGGAGGSMSSVGGVGAFSAAGGAGGSVGNAGRGGKGGSVSITSKNNAVSVSAILSTRGGTGGIQTGVGGDGGFSSDKIGGAGGSIGGGGKGGDSGDITLSSNSTIAVSANLQAFGGLGGNVSGSGGTGGDGDSEDSRGGAGGSLGTAGAGGGGGKVEFKGKAALTFLNIQAYGGLGGDMTGTGGNGGGGATGGAGGGLGFGVSGAGGGGGTVIMTTSQNGPGTGTITVTGAQVDLNGGNSGAYQGHAGNGGDGDNGAGGAGGAAGNQGAGGDGGKVFLTGSDLSITPTGSITTNGGRSVGYYGVSGNGGDAGVNGRGGDGGAVGFAGDGGGGGLMLMDFKNTVSVESTGSDSISARGGDVGRSFNLVIPLIDAAVSGHGGKGAGTGDGGKGGSIAKNGSAGAGGKIQITGDTGDMTGLGVLVAAGGQVNEVSATTGHGGDGGATGAGGNSGDFATNGDGGKGGEIKLSSSSGIINFESLIVTGGDIVGIYHPSTADGGTGGTTSGAGGSSGKILNNGTGGSGGTINITTKTGRIGPIVENAGAAWIATAGIVKGMAASTGDGGDATKGNGGSSGSIGNNGAGGEGGKIFLTSSTGNIFLPKGGIYVPGADGGLMGCTTGNGGSTISGNGGVSGAIGDNSSGGKAGRIEISTLTGAVNLTGISILRGGQAMMVLNETGQGGNSEDAKGGVSGTIGNGGNGGAGGVMIIKSGVTVTGGEDIVADGGNAAGQSIFGLDGELTSTPQFYTPKTGNGGNGGAVTGAGGKSGDIGKAGVAGDGGTIEISSKFGDINPAHIFVNGGKAGSDPFVTQPPFPPVNVPASQGIQQGQTGNGGDGGKLGGAAGRVGEGVAGGNGGKITLFAGGNIFQSSEYQAMGGNGGATEGIGGDGGDGVNAGGGGAIGASGSGGRGGSISLTTATVGADTIRAVESFGGDAGYNDGEGGDGGTGLFTGGAGGKLEGSGSGGKGGSLSYQALLSGSTLDFVDNQTINLSGGKGGDITGTGGDGGSVSGPNDGQGGAGGGIGFAGGGGKGGTIEIKLKGGEFTSENSVQLRGGHSGTQAGGGGKGGNSKGAKPGGDGGAVDIQGGGGDGGTFTFDGGSMTLLAARLFNLNGGDGSSYTGTGGNGGKGGGTGGAGGAIGSAGAGGVGGIIDLSASTGLTINGDLSANGGNRASIVVTSGTGGDGMGAGGSGGAGGAISLPGAAGKGGKIIFASLLGGASGTGILSTVGGVSFGGDFTSGDGGTASQTGKGDGGIGGEIAGGPGGGEGGTIDIDVFGNITGLAFNAFGGDVIGTYTAQSGKGGNAGIKAGTGGNGGGIKNGGNGGGGGGISLASDSGTIAPAGLLAYGGNVSAMNATSGKGGSQAAVTGTGAGGSGGTITNNGNGGDGGIVKVKTDGEINSTTDWNANGGDVGGYTATSGKGGDGNGVTVSGAGAGGAGGDLGSNGKGGDGGQFTITAKNLDVTLDGALLANGGTVLASYTGQTGIGGDSPRTGGEGGSTGSAGRGGTGGMITIGGQGASISTKLLSAFGGDLHTVQQGAITGGGGNGNTKGGGGGTVGEGAAGGGGGQINVTSMNDSVMIDGNILAHGGRGGPTAGLSGNGHNATGTASTGGNGGNAASSGAGGGGGLVVLKAGTSLTITGSTNANAANGGNQGGIGGAGGSGSAKGGNGGSIRDSGAGGDGNKVVITTAPGQFTGTTPTAAGGNPGLQGGMPGAAGAGPGGVPGTPGQQGRQGTNGTVIINGVISYSGNVEEDNDYSIYKKRKRLPTYVALESKNHRYADFVQVPEETTSGELSASDLRPIAFMQPAVPTGLDAAKTLASIKVKSAVAKLVSEHLYTRALSQRLAKAGVVLCAGTGTDNFKLDFGAALFAPAEDSISIRTVHGVIQIDAGAKALVDVTDDATIVRTLHDRGHGDVRFVHGKQTTKIGLARELVVTQRSAKEIDSVVYSQIASRNPVVGSMAGVLTVRMSEFSLVSALSSDETLKALYRSPESIDKKQVAPILKNASAFGVTSLGRGRYETR